MRKILLTSIKNVKLIFVAAILILAVNFMAGGHADLIGAIFIGGLLAAFYIASTAARIASVSTLSTSEAKRKMIFGLILRLLMLFVVLLFAVNISVNVFIATAISFFVFYLIALLGLTITSYKLKFPDDKLDDDVDKNL